MAIIATVTHTDGGKEQRYFHNMMECAEWMEKEYQQYTAIDAREVSAKDIRQRRDGEWISGKR